MCLHLVPTGMEGNLNSPGELVCHFLSLVSIFPGNQDLYKCLDQPVATVGKTSKVCVHMCDSRFYVSLNFL